jgi:small subunit ribosomal protein S1
MTSEPNDFQEPAPETPEVTPAAPESTPAPDDEPSTEFAALLADQAQAAPPEPKAGDKVTGTIVQITDTEAMIDCGGRSEIPMAIDELRDDQGQLAHNVGDSLDGHLAKAKDGGLKFTLAINLREAGRRALADACASGTPVEGKVGETNKGGFSISLSGVRAFCPFSQIDLRRADDPTLFVGKTFNFKVVELSEDGRNVVVSRRAYLQEHRDTEATRTRHALALGDVREGTVTRLVPFGAFIDIGGVEGLVHISQISHQRVANPADVLREGQPVKVKVLEIQNLGGGRNERISLSIKALASDPWPTSASSLQPHTDVTGRVTRLVDFGVFVELLPGIEGLIHISELANRRIVHPREVVNEDEEVTVRIVDVDLSRRRISLSRKQAADYDGD